MPPYSLGFIMKSLRISCQLFLYHTNVSGYSKKYFEEHRDVLTLRKAAKQAFDEYVKEHGKDTPLPKLAELNAEYAMILERKKKTYATYRKEKEEMQDYLIAQKIAAVILCEEDQQREEAHSEPEKKQR